ncbi:MAG: hypothetical protein AAGJ93_02485 [Bacteroidota bacterium]
MPREFDKLTDAEQQLMLDAIPLITILVGGADGDMDDNEIEWAQKLTEVRSYDFNSKLKDYFQAVGAQFDSKLGTYNDSLPKETAARMAAVSELLAGLNPILKKIDSFDADVYYKNFLSFAEHVAKASGGILRFMSIGKEEKEVIGLPMLEDFKI